MILKQLSLDKQSNADCEENLRKTRLGERFELDDSFTCAGGKAGVDACRGDGGGPLMCPRRNTWNGKITHYVQVKLLSGMQLHKD